MPTTSNFGWTTPADTDLVKDGAAAIRTLGNGIDASFLDLKGGTTNQVLAKNSNTDLDFKWVADASGIPATIFDAKGDIIAATAADTADRLAVGTNGQVLTADSTTATGLKWATPAAGGMTQLATGSLSGTTVTLSSIASTYRDLRLVIENYKPATDATWLRLQVNGDSNTRYFSVLGTDSGFNESFNLTSSTVSGGSDNSVANGLIIIDFPEYANSVTWKMWNSQYILMNATTTTNFNTGTYYSKYNQTTAISSITLLNNAGDFTSGNYYLYGVK